MSGHLRGFAELFTKTFLPLILILLTFSQLSVAQPLPESTLVAIMSGRMSDASADQISNKAMRGQGNSGMYQLMGDLKKAGFTTLFFNWNGTSAGHYNDDHAPGAKAIAAAIRDAYAKHKKEHLVLIGHSWGGHTMLEVAQRLNSEPPIKIELAIGIDPTSFGLGERARQLPSNIGRLVSFRSRNAFGWTSWKDETRVEPIDLGNPANGYMKNGNPDYAAAFDLTAHNAIEWDERVHAELISRINKTAAQKHSSPMGGTEHTKATVDASP
jgi:pimeloyl-ACP methyl ester carboxylesterase